MDIYNEKQGNAWLKYKKIANQVANSAFPVFNLSQLQNFSFATSTELIGCAGIKPDATLERTAEWKAQAKTGFYNYLNLIG